MTLFCHLAGDGGAVIFNSVKRKATTTTKINKIQKILNFIKNERSAKITKIYDDVDDMELRSITSQGHLRQMTQFGGDDIHNQP